MGITAQEALGRLDNITTKEALTALINELDIVGNGKSTTLLFSGGEEVKNLSFPLS